MFISLKKYNQSSFSGSTVFLMAYSNFFKQVTNNPNV